MQWLPLQIGPDDILSLFKLPNFTFVWTTHLSCLLTITSLQFLKNTNKNRISIEQRAMYYHSSLLVNGTNKQYLIFDKKIFTNCRSLVQKVCDILQDFYSVVVLHVHREGNFATDFLSHFAYSFSRGLHVLDTPPLGYVVD